MTLFSASGRIETPWNRHNDGEPLRHISLGGSEHLTADDFCLFGRASRKCGCGFCREQVARERDQEGPV